MVMTQTRMSYTSPKRERGTMHLSPRLRVGLVSGGEQRAIVPRRGAALLVCIFVVALTATIVVSMLEIETTEMAASRNTVYYEQALYAAGAAAHHALAELAADPSWRAGIATTEFPAGSGNTYSATIVNGVSGQVVITAVGTASGVTRRLQVTVQLL